MPNILQKSDISEWYRQLNVARTQSGIGLAAVATPTVNRDSSVTPVNKLISDIVASKTASSNFLGVADTPAGQVSSGQIITGKENIDSSLISLLRVCPNVSCKTVAHHEYKAVTYDESMSIVWFTNGLEGCDTNGNQAAYTWACNGDCHGQTTAFFTEGWGFGHSIDASFQAGAGNNNTFYSGTTYSLKNHYTEEEAKKR